MTLALYAIFFGAVVLLAAVDYGLMRRRSRGPGSPAPLEAGLSALLWLLAAIVFAFALSYGYQVGFLGLGSGPRSPTPDEVWLQFFTAYATEVALSLDNIMAMAAVFAYLGVTGMQRHRVLFWTILASLVARGALIGMFGQALHLEWTRYLFAALLLAAMVRTLLVPDEHTDIGQRWFVRRLTRAAGGTSTAVGGTIGSRVLAALLVALVADMSFALDSIPAVFSVTREPVVALTSNALAVMALRALYFTLAPTIGRFRYLKVAVTLVLLGLAAKMVFAWNGPGATITTLGGLVLVVGVGMLASAIRPAEHRPTPLEDLSEAAAATRRNFRKMLVLIAGTAIVLFGIAIAPLPGPGPLVLVPIGLTLLATEFVWARALLDRFKKQAAALQQRTETLSRQTPKWVVPLPFVALAVIVLVLIRYAHLPVSGTILGAVGPLIPLSYWAYRTIKPRREPPASAKN